MGEVADGCPVGATVGGVFKGRDDGTHCGAGGSVDITYRVADAYRGGASL